MINFSRREFLFAGLGSLFLGAKARDAKIMTINGPIAAHQLGKTLIHEHFLVDFIGADTIRFDRWNRNEVVKIVSPYLLEAKQAGVKSIFDCTPDFLGRDVVLLQMLAAQSGIQMITNTGNYGARGNKYLPPWAFTETQEQLAARWIQEYENGIGNTGIKPGFIKIGVDDSEFSGQITGPLSEIHQKLVRAAAITHLKTGLTICSHTGHASAAFEEIDILEKSGVHPSAFVWVHAQKETDKMNHTLAARRGVWVSLDGIGWGDFDNYADSITRLKEAKLLHRVLISHDAGWYEPGKPDHIFQGYTNIFKELLPRLRQRGYSENDFDQLLVKNPAKAMSIQTRRR